ncbi:MAG: hypothetical protein R3C31_03990 [Hyphomonadaceae bacterium]
MTNATLTITRKSSFTAMLRDAAILVDEQRVAVVGNDKSVEIQIAPGSHAIRTRMDWMKSEPLQLDAVAGQRYAAELTLCNPFVMLLAIFGMRPFMELRAL